MREASTEARKNRYDATRWLLQLCTIVFGALALPFAAPGASGWPDGNYMFVLTSEYDYSAGNTSLMDVIEPWQHENFVEPISGDAVARSYEGLIYVVNRFGADNIQVIDPAAGFSTIRQFSVGPGSNPQDICFVSETRAFVSRYESAELWEVDPTTGEHTDSIDLSPLADGDGIPEMHSMFIADGKLFLALQRLDRDNYWVPVPPSYLAVIDLEDNSLIDVDPETPGIQGIRLSATNPNSFIIEDPTTGNLLLGECGAYGAADGGIEAVDPLTMTSQGMLIDEATLGGDINSWDTLDGALAYCVVLSPTWTTSIVCVDLRSGTKEATIATSSEYAYAHVNLEPSSGDLFVADRTFALPGVRVFDGETGQEKTTNPIGVGLYPSWLLEMHGVHSGVEEPACALATHRLQGLWRGRHLFLRVPNLEGCGIATLLLVGADGRSAGRFEVCLKDGVGSLEMPRPSSAGLLFGTLGGADVLARGRIVVLP